MKGPRLQHKQGLFGRTWGRTGEWLGPITIGPMTLSTLSLCLSFFRQGCGQESYLSCPLSRSLSLSLSLSLYLSLSRSLPSIRTLRLQEQVYWNTHYTQAHYITLHCYTMLHCIPFSCIMLPYIMHRQSHVHTCMHACTHGTPILQSCLLSHMRPSMNPSLSRPWPCPCRLVVGIQNFDDVNLLGFLWQLLR